MSGPDFEQEFLEGLRTVSADGTKKPPPITPADPTEAIETVDIAPEVSSAGTPVLVSSVTAKNVFQHPDTHPVVLDLLLLRKYGPEWMIWEPETLELRIPQDFRTSNVSEANISKVNAVKTMHMVDTYWQQWEVFNWCTMALNGVPPDFVVMQVPSVAQCLVSVDIANRLRNDLAWSIEVLHFLEAVHRHDDIFVPQPPLDFVPVDIEGLPIDVPEILKRWPEVRASGRPDREESITAEQLRRMLIVHGFLEESRTHLRQQLSLVQDV